MEQSWTGLDESIMAHGELIRPVQGISEGRRYAARVAAGSLLLVIGVVAAVKGSTRKPASLANGSSSLGNVHAAQSAANTAESNVATFLAAMKAQRSEPTRTDAHALDWNWAPELERSQKVKNWVGKSWVEPLGGQKIVKIAPPKVGVVRNRLTEAMDSVGRAKKVASKQMTLHMQDQQDMPRLSPLHYFANKAGGSTVSTDWNTQDVIKLAKRSVDFVQHGFKSGTESHESKSATRYNCCARLTAWAQVFIAVFACIRASAYAICCITPVVYIFGWSSIY